MIVFPSFDATTERAATPNAGAGVALRFARQHRRAIEELVAQAPRLAEVARTFPALLFALATGYGCAERRQAALALVARGALLRTAAEALGLPWWTRRLLPECLEAPFPVLPDSAAFTLCVHNYMPTEPDEAAAWLARVAFAYRTVGEDYALWIARQRRFPSGVVGDISETLLAGWAWHCRHTHAPAHRLVRIPWSDTISQRRAIEEAKSWSMRIDLAVAVGSGIEDSWFPAGRCADYEFVPLVRLEQFLSEAEAMSNCLDQFADKVREGRSRVFSIRKGGRIVADVEVGAHEDDCCIPRIVQLRGPRNRRAAADIWQATLGWLAAQEYRPLPRVNELADRQRRQQLIRMLWRPMLDSLKGTPAEKRMQALAFGKELSPSFRVFQAAASEAGRPDQHGRAAVDPEEGMMR